MLMAFFFSVLLTVIIVLATRAMYAYKKRRNKDQAYEMEGNPCYASVNVKLEQKHCHKANTGALI